MRGIQPTGAAVGLSRSEHEVAALNQVFSIIFMIFHVSMCFHCFVLFERSQATASSSVSSSVGSSNLAQHDPVLLCTLRALMALYGTYGPDMSWHSHTFSIYARISRINAESLEGPCSLPNLWNIHHVVFCGSAHILWHLVASITSRGRRI